MNKVSGSDGDSIIIQRIVHQISTEWSKIKVTFVPFLTTLGKGVNSTAIGNSYPLDPLRKVPDYSLQDQNVANFCVFVSPCYRHNHLRVHGAFRTAF